MSVKSKMLSEFGPKALKRPATCGELYAAIDAVTESFQALKARVEELEAAPIRYRGVWQRADEYRRGHVVTDNGSAWCAIRNVPVGERPGSSAGWQLMVKAGKDASRP